MNQLISKLKKIVLDNPKGHLPLHFRVELAKKINNPIIINKIYLECVKLVYLTHNIEDSTLSNIINQSEEFLYKTKFVNFQDLYSKYKNYIEGMLNQPYAGVAVTVQALCSSLANNASSILNIEDYEGQDDISYDWEEWNTDFFASKSYSEESPVKCRKFWLWFLDKTNQVYNSPNSIPSSKIKVENFIPLTIKRTKEYKTETINSILDKVVMLIIEDAKDKNWTKIEIEGQNIGGMGMKGMFLEDDTYHRLEFTYYLYGKEKSSVHLMQKIKDEIYAQIKEEGTWFSYNLIINSNTDYQIKYNFDFPSIYKDKEPNLEVFVAEFEKYPRLKHFTPTWWQEIVDKNSINYLDS